MEWGLIITKLVIASDAFDDEWLHMEITEPLQGDKAE